MNAILCPNEEFTSHSKTFYRMWIIFKEKTFELLCIKHQFGLLISFPWKETEGRGVSLLHRVTLAYYAS